MELLSWLQGEADTFTANDANRLLTQKINNTDIRMDLGLDQMYTGGLVLKDGYFRGYVVAVKDGVEKVLGLFDVYEDRVETRDDVYF